MLKLILLLTLSLHYAWSQAPVGAALGPYNDQTLKLSTSVTDGPALSGANVTVIFPNGTSEVSLWKVISGSLAGARGTGWSLTFSGLSTYPAENELGNNSLGLWYLALDVPISWLIIDLYSGNAVWDVIKNNDTEADTSNSGNGFPFTIYNPTLETLNLSYYYNGIPTIPNRKLDLWYVLNIHFLVPYVGIVTFQADTDSLIAIQSGSCTVLPIIDPYETKTAPELISDGSVPTIYNVDNRTRLHLELKFLAAANRKSGFDKSSATYISFGKALQDPPGCDIPWIYSRSTMNNTCYDIYTLDADLDLLSEFCNVTKITDENQNLKIVGALYIRSLFDRYLQGPNLTDIYQEFSELGFSIKFNLVAATTQIKPNAPIELSAVIYQYDIPLGTTAKTFYVRTIVQRGFEVVYNSTVGLRQVLVDGVSDPLPESGLLDARFDPITNGCLPNSNVSNLFCEQNWILSVTPDFSVCKLTNVHYFVPFTLECSDPSSVFCVLNDSSISIDIFLDTSSFCPFLVGNYSYVATLATYDHNFTEARSSFFVNDRVGFELTISDNSGSLKPEFSSIELSFLATGMGSSTLLSLFPPAIYTLNDPSVHILIGDTTSLDGIQASIEPNVCDLFSCEKNVLRFRFVLASNLWSPQPDDFFRLKVVLIAEFNLGGNSKKIYFEAGAPKGLSAGNDFVVKQPSNTSGSTIYVVAYILIFFNLFVSFVFF